MQYEAIKAEAEEAAQQAAASQQPFSELVGLPAPCLLPVLLITCHTCHVQLTVLLPMGSGQAEADYSTAHRPEEVAQRWRCGLA